MSLDLFVGGVDGLNPVMTDYMLKNEGTKNSKHCCRLVPRDFPELPDRKC